MPMGIIAERLPYFGGDGIRVGEVVVPEAEDIPPGFAKLFRYRSVPRPVPGQLRDPVTAVAAWVAAVPGAAVPEAPVHENGEALPAKYEVRLARQGFVAAPAFDGVGTHDGCESQFGLSVAP